MRANAAAGLTPSAARRLLGQELQSARSRARLSLADAAKAIERSAATLSRLENGRHAPRALEVKALIDSYRTASPAAVPDEAEDRILALTDTARREEWFSSYRDVLAGRLTSNEARQLVEFESNASAIRTFEPDLVPGLLQTAAYAAAVTDVFHADRSQHDRERLVEFRLSRQQILSREKRPAELHAVIGEAALRHVVGSSEVMHSQLTTLAAIARDGRPNISVRVAPLDLALPATLGGPFAVLDLHSEAENGLVYLEGRESALFMQTEDDVTRYRSLYESLDKAIAADDRSVAVLEEALARLS